MKLSPFTILAIKTVKASAISAIVTGMVQGYAQNPLSAQAVNRKSQCSDGVARNSINTQIGCMDLLNAAKDGDIQRLEALLAKGADVNCAGPLQITPLMVAVSERRHECVEWLLSHGGDPNLQDDKGRSAVSLAAGAFDDSKALVAVLSNGGNPNIFQGSFELDDGTIIRMNRTPIYDAISGDCSIITDD